MIQARNREEAQSQRVTMFGCLSEGDEEAVVSHRDTSSRQYG